MSLLFQASEMLYFQTAAGQLYCQISAQVLALMLSTGTYKILSLHGQRAPLPSSARPKLGCGSIVKSEELKVEKADGRFNH